MSWIIVGLLSLLIYCLLKSCSESEETMPKPNNNIHDHDLVKESCDIYTCGRCMREGSEERFKCRSCNLILHPKCRSSRLKKERTFQKRKFQLHTTPLPIPRLNSTRRDSSTEKYWRCEACEKKVKGYMYHCPETDVVFHPFCFPKVIKNQNRHNHGLVKDDTCKGNHYTCSGCKRMGMGSRFSCSQGCEDYNLHHECMAAPPELKIGKIKCHFHEKPPPRCGDRKCYGKCVSCDACGTSVEGFHYSCSFPSEEKWFLHPCCAKLPHENMIDDVLFSLKRQEDDSSCALCNNKQLKDARNIPGWSYASKHINYSFHVYCIMEMAIQYSSTTSSKKTNVAISNGDFSLEVLQEMKLTDLKKSKNIGGTNSSKLLKILKFFSSVISLLLGDPVGISVDILQLLFNQD